MRFLIIGTLLLSGMCTAQDNLLTEPGFHTARARASADAYTIFDTVNRARAAIKAGDLATASNQVTQALQAAKRLGAAGNVPIYIELTELFAKGGVGAQPTLSSDGDRLRTGATDQAINSTSAMLQYTTMSLNMAGVGAHLQAADAALSDREAKAADSELAAVQNAVTMQSVARDVPLLRARQNLTIAAEQARQGAWQVVQTTLRTAAGQIRDSGVGDAARLADQINAYAANIVSQHTDASAQIEDWWDHTARLSDEAPGPK